MMLDGSFHPPDVAADGASRAAGAHDRHHPVRAAAAAAAVASFTQARAAAHDRGEADLGPDVAALADAGLLAAPLPVSDGGVALALGAGTVDETLAVLSALGAANLSLARLYEGHLNALELIVLFGSPAERRRAAADATAGRLFGVWGADDGAPVRMERSGNGHRLAGAKRFASGIGIVTRALIPVESEAGRRLSCLPVEDEARMDRSTWDMRGMRASVSGRYDFTGITVDDAALIGPPGAYSTEPHFKGGIWRCAAAQVGAIEAILAAAASHLARLGRADDPFQLARIGRMQMAARSARLMVADAAHAVEGCGAADAAAIARAVALAGQARLATEAAGTAVIELADRSVGLAGHVTGHPLDRLVRDLGVYLRQAAPDALLVETARTLLDNGDRR